MGDERLVGSELARSLRQATASGPSAETIDDSGVQPTASGLGGTGVGFDDDQDSDEEISTEALLRLAIQRKGLSGSAAVSGVSQLLEVLDTLGEGQEETDKGPQTCAGSRHPEESGETRSSRRGREPPKKIDVIGTNSFAALLRGGDIIPHSLTDALSNDQFLPLAFFLSSELARRNTTNTQYQFKASAAHERQVIDTSGYEDRDLRLSRDQFVDAHRNLLRAYQVSYGPAAVADLVNYQDRLYSDNIFHLDGEFPAFRQFDRAVRLAWHNKEGGHYPLARDDTFAHLDRFINKMYSDNNAALARAVSNMQAGATKITRGRHSRSASPQHRSPLPHSFHKGSRSEARRARCILCGSPKHTGYLCSFAGAKCTLQGTGLSVKSTSERLCFDYNISKGCDKQGKQHGVHRCSVCLETEHGAQKCPTDAGQHRD
jgi:hypothetical protein